MEIVVRDTIFSAYIEAINQVLKFGKIAYSNDRNRGDVIQLDNLISEIKHPDNQKVQHPYWKGSKLDTYKSLELVENDFEYTYIDRLRKFIDGTYDHGFGRDIDQLDKCIDILKEDNGGRRALGVTWRPEIDLFKEEVPCMVMNQYKINDGKLNVNAVWRSHDIYGAYYPNLILLHEIQKYVADGVGVPTGKMTVMSMNPHIYLINQIEAKKLAKSMPLGW